MQPECCADTTHLLRNTYFFEFLMLHIDYITNSIFNSRTYILSDGSDKVWLVDCGDGEPLLPIVGRKRVGGVLLSYALLSSSMACFHFCRCSLGIQYS